MALPDEGQHVKVTDDNGDVLYCGVISLLHYGYADDNLGDGTGWVTVTITPCEGN